MSVKNGPTKGLTKTYCPARIGMTLETLDVKLHFFFFFSWPAPTPCFWDYCFHKMARRENILFQVSWELLLRGISFTTCTYQSRQALGWNTEGRKGEISSDLAPRCRQNGRHCAPPLLWLNATCSRWGSNQSSPLLAQSKGIFIDTLALTLAPGSALSAGGPRASPEPASVFLFRGAIVCHDLQEFVDTTYSTPGTRCTILKNRERTKCAVDQREWETQVIKHVLRIKLSADLKARDGIQKILKGWRALNSLMQNKRKTASKNIQRWDFPSDTALIRNIHHWVYAGGIGRQRSVHLRGAPV